MNGEKFHEKSAENLDFDFREFEVAEDAINRWIYDMPEMLKAEIREKSPAELIELWMDPTGFNLNLDRFAQDFGFADLAEAWKSPDEKEFMIDQMTSFVMNAERIHDKIRENSEENQK
jgi:hypothetical protein